MENIIELLVFIVPVPDMALACVSPGILEDFCICIGFGMVPGGVCDGSAHANSHARTPCVTGCQRHMLGPAPKGSACDCLTMKIWVSTP